MPLHVVLYAMSVVLEHLHTLLHDSGRFPAPYPVFYVSTYAAWGCPVKKSRETRRTHFIVEK